MKGSFTNFDPSQFGKYTKASINGGISSTGRLAPVLQLEADHKIFDSSTPNGRAANGKIHWRSKGIKTPDISVDLAVASSAWRAPRGDGIGENAVASRRTALTPLRELVPSLNRGPHSPRIARTSTDALAAATQVRQAAGQYLC